MSDTTNQCSFMQRLRSIPRFGFTLSDAGGRIIKSENLSNWIDRDEAMKVMGDAQGAIGTLQAENARLRQQLDDIKLQKANIASRLANQDAVQIEEWRSEKATMKAKIATLQANIEQLQEALHDLENRHSNNCHYMTQFKQRIQTLLGTEEDNWSALLDMLESASTSPFP